VKTISDEQQRIESLVGSALFDAFRSERMRAIRTLHEEFPDDPRIVVELKAYVDDLDNPNSLTHLNWGNDQLVRRNLLEALKILADRGNANAAAVIQEALQDPTKAGFKRTALLSGELLDAEKRDAQSLIPRLTDPSPYVRRIAAEYLGNLASPQSIEGLVRALKDDAVPVQRAAAEALRKLRRQLHSDEQSASAIAVALKEYSATQRAHQTKLP
jgi:HEAT repeat protein